MQKRKKKRKSKNALVGKDVRIVVNLGNLTLKYRGILKELNDWVVIETKEGVKLINKSDCVLIEKFK
jgi:Ni2+-binding GTPase involved in maturation of urease and hydrogenase